MRYVIGFSIVMVIVSYMFFSETSRDAGVLFWGILAGILSIISFGWVRNDSS
ncbi:MAG: hypothetical protein HOC91_01620 [Nitrospinaceae bacterium]|jgi:hypothetical protein|nr:hypothetical protein [Nitrospinaceae bacterium]MBT3435688.1 hypothetical protein [Nitrospinaceae bacterium]MBT3823271.1 hypothetical protein [Nitrospinaceae bacterium]MBT4092623.1 hypothetical protein [Nitrospinaceae bacterium]MBT4429193.1 hypothetical protein [Nitrospinaceae bacterium]